MTQQCNTCTHVSLKYNGSEFVLSQTTLSLIKFAEKRISIYNSKKINYESVSHNISNDAHLIS